MTPVWCVKSDEGWCATERGRLPSVDAGHDVTRCGHVVHIRVDEERRLPTCPECLATARRGPAPLKGEGRSIQTPLGAPWGPEGGRSERMQRWVAHRFYTQRVGAERPDVTDWTAFQRRVHLREQAVALDVMLALEWSDDGPYQRLRVEVDAQLETLGVAS